MKTNKIFIKTFLAGLLVIFSANSCKKSFYDINQNPNNPADVAIEQLLPSAEAGIGVALSNNFGIFGGLYAQYWTQATNASQYRSYEQYNASTDNYDFPWAALYSDGLKDLESIEIKAIAQNKLNYVAIARILKAYSYQLLTDNFGDVPYKEALKGDKGILSPHYDNQQEIYDSIISNLQSGIALIDENEAAPGADDLILQGDMSLWRKFGNTLLLKVYLRLSEIDPGKSQAGVMSFDTLTEFLSEGEIVKINYVSSGGNTNPLYSEMAGLQNTQNLVASSTAIDFFNNNNDFRVFALYNPVGGNFVGIPQGDFNNTIDANSISYPTSITGGSVKTPDDQDASAVAPVILLGDYESLFLQAEAAARGWLAAGSEQSLYERAITASFLSLNTLAGEELFAEQDAIDYYSQDPGDTRDVIAFPAAGSLQDKLKAILTQKWAAMCGIQNDEAWIEWRRTGYPDFFTVSVNSSIGAGRFPERLLYPNSEVTFNGSFPGQRNIFDRVWWDPN